MKFKLLVIFLLALFILPAQQIMAKLVLEGTLATDITFEKSSIGSIIANPDVYFPASTKLGLIMKSDDSTEQIRAYFPFLLNLSTLQIGNNLGQYLTGSEVSPDNWRQFFGSNYYFVAKGNPLVAGLANRKVGDDPDYAFFSFDDGLGAFSALNSDQPLLTTKLHGAWGKTKLAAYKIWDQPVAYLPVRELLPQTVADYEVAPGEKIGSYPYRGEMADYTFFEIQEPLAGWQVAVNFGKKQVDNPQFYSTATDQESVSKEGLRIEKENYGLNLKRTLASGVEISASFLESQGDWSHYAGTSGSTSQWEAIGKTSGGAGQISVRDLALGPASLNFLYRAIEPGFQAVAARDENYAYGWFNRVVDDPETTLLCRALPDPMGRYSQQEVPSRLLTYLGMRSTEAEIAIPGQIGGLYGNLQLTGQEHNSIDQPREMDYDPRTGDDRIKDFREVGAKVTLLPESGDIIATRLLDRDYLADWDRLRQIQIQWLRPLSETLSSEFRVEKYDRLRSFQDYATVPESHYRDAGYLNRFAWKVTGITKGGSVLQSDLDLRQGTYEKDLLFETADHVFDLPYNVGRLSFFVEKPLNWNTARGQVNIDLASEFTCLRGHANATPLAAGLGTSVVGMVKVSYPWTKFIRHETLLLGVSGPNGKHFPSNYLRSTWHNELLISPWGDGNCKLKVGYTRRPLNKENVYAAITGGSGFGNWSITVGKGTLWEFTETPYVLPGQYCRQEALLDPEIAGKPWQDWRNLNLARGSETTAQNLVVLRYWYSF